MARIFKEPSATSFKSDRTSSLTRFITCLFFSNYKLLACKIWQPNLLKKHTFSLIFPSCFLFLTFFFIFCFLFLCKLMSDRRVSPTNRDVGRRPSPYTHGDFPIHDLLWRLGRIAWQTVRWTDWHVFKSTYWLTDMFLNQLTGWYIFSCAIAPL